jgi:hypothetical protein
MAKSERFIPAEVSTEPLTRVKRLAEKMARVLNNEDVSDVAIARERFVAPKQHRRCARITSVD